MLQKGSVKPLMVKTEDVEVEIITHSYRIVGHIHKVPNGRLTDFINRSSVQGSSEHSIFLPITNAVYTSRLDDEQLQYKSHFMLVNKAHVEVIIPREEVGK